MLLLPWRLSLLLLGSSWLRPTRAQSHTSSADYFVGSLPGAPEPLLRMHAGHIEISPEHHGNLFFWHFANRHIGDRRRTVLWLNGGPGCSSLDGALMEVGPYRVRGEKLELNNGAWDEFANLLFVDSPVGTGFSYADSNSYVHELSETADQLVTFLEKFFVLFPDYVTDDLYIGGESFAGQYIPYTARAILDRNAKSTQKWSLSGLIIGNGWITPDVQYMSYLPYAYKEGLIQKDSEAAQLLEREQGVCADVLKKNGADSIDVAACENVLLEILRQNRKEKGGTNAPCINMYDVRKTDSYPECGSSWPGDLPDLTTWLRRNDVRNALHVNSNKKGGWQECNSNVHAAMTAKHSVPAWHLLPDLLAELPILLFNGDRDLICNHLGQEAAMNALTFNSGKGMETSPGTTAPRLDWFFDGALAGTYQEARNLTQVLFYNTSHMVPYDEAARTLDMLNRFMRVDPSYLTQHSRPASVIDGEDANLPLPSSNSSSGIADDAAEQARLNAERWRAYYRSGEVALVVVAIAAGAWIWFIVRQRRRTKGYKGLLSSIPDEDGDQPPPRGDYAMAVDNARRAERAQGGSGLGGLGKGRRDLEAADFDETELDELTRSGGPDSARFRDRERERFDIGIDEEDEESDDGDVTTGATGGKANGHARKL